MELRTAFRSLLRTPGVSAAAVVNLALGVAAVTFTFSLTYGSVFRGLPVPEGERIYRVFRTFPAQGVNRMSVSRHDYVDWRQQQTSFEQLAAADIAEVNVTTALDPTRLEAAFITLNGFNTLRMQPLLGRGFLEGEDESGSPAVVVLGHHVWRDLFASEPDVLGREIKVDGEPTTVVGVMSEGFRFPENQDLWLPLELQPLPAERGAGRGLIVFGRLADGVSEATASSEYQGIARRLAEAYPQSNEGLSAGLLQYARAFMGPEGDATMLTFLGIVFLVLLVACVNVANLLLVRAAGRTREVAIRSALGAKRRQILFRLLLEAGSLAFAGAVLGTVLAWLGLAVFNPLAEATEPPYWFTFELDAPVLLFVAGLVVLVTLISGAVPGLRISGTPPGDVLKDQSRGSTSLRIGRLTRGLVVAEVALSLSLLVASGLSIRSIVELGRLDLPFNTSDVLHARMRLQGRAYQEDRARDEFHELLLERIRSRPGVATAALTTSAPGMFGAKSRVEILGQVSVRTEDIPRVWRVAVTPEFFETFETPILQGRQFTRADYRSAPPVAVVNEAFAERFFPDREPVGQQFREQNGASYGETITIVGVAPNLKMDGLQSLTPDPWGYYRPLAQADAHRVSIVARSHSDPLALAPAVRDVVHGLNPDIPLYEVNSMREILLSSMWQVNLFGGIFFIFGLIALSMASVGLYGVMAFATRQRTQEVGIRIALGAQGGHVVRLVLKQGLFQLVAGLTMGLLLALGMGVVTQGWYYGVSSTDPAVTVGVAAVLALTGIAAMVIPARQATRVDPVEALRFE